MNKKKKVAILSTWDHGGSGTAAYSLTKLLSRAGYETCLIVRDRTIGDDRIIAVTPKAGRFPILRRIKRKINSLLTKPVERDEKYYFLQLNENESLVKASDIMERLPFKPDIIFTALISGFVNTEVLADLAELTGADVHMLSVDMAPLTGGCHYAWDCTGYQRDCANCPAILTESQKNIAAENLAIKKKNIERGGIKLLVGSAAVEEMALKSTLFKDQKEYLVTNGFIDMKTFNRDKRSIAREVFGLPNDIKIIFTGSSYTKELRKGFVYFFEALNILWDSMDPISREQTCILVAGSGFNIAEFESHIKFRVITIDFIKDYRLLALAYQAVDVFVCSSIEDVGPLMVPEALACGTPVVGFDIGYMKELVVNGYNGFKVPNKDSRQMADRIKAILELDERTFEEFSVNATRHIKEFSSEEFMVKAFNKLAYPSHELEKSSHTAV